MITIIIYIGINTESDIYLTSIGDYNYNTHLYTGINTESYIYLTLIEDHTIYIVFTYLQHSMVTPGGLIRADDIQILGIVPRKHTLVHVTNLF